MANPAPRRSWRRQGRVVILVAGAAFLAVVLAVLFGRDAEVPYAPGLEGDDGGEITRTLDREMPQDLPPVRFVDAAEAAGIAFRHAPWTRTTQLPEDMGSGLAWGDYDGDGDPDLYLVNESTPLNGPEAAGASGAGSALYRNDGDGTFTDVTREARVGALGMGMGAAWGDYDGDGDLDLVVTRFGTVLLYRNDGDGTFADVSGETGVGAEEGFWAGASWADYDRDGDLDLYVCGYVDYDYDPDAARQTSYQYRAVVPFTLNPSTYAPQRNLLFRNDGGVFRETAVAAGVDNPSGRSLSASWGDLDDDGWPDLYVANDISDNALFHNRGDGRFDDVSHSAWVADYRGAMGMAVGDWDSDADMDLFVTHWIAQENAFYENQADLIPGTPDAPLHFVDEADLHGLGQIALDYIGWGTEFLDYDNDGRLDLFVVNGSTFQREEDPSRLVAMRNLLFRNDGPERGFFEIGPASGEVFAVENVGRGAAAADYDGDGDLDVAVLVRGGGARLLRNDGGNAGGWLRVVLRAPAAAAGSGPAGTTFATGARVRLVTGERAQLREVGGSSSYMSQSPPGEVRFGVGAARRVDLLAVRWPDGVTEEHRDLPADATVTLVQGHEPVVQIHPRGRRTP